MSCTSFLAKNVNSCSYINLETGIIAGKSIDCIVRKVGSSHRYVYSTTTGTGGSITIDNTPFPLGYWQRGNEYFVEFRETGTDDIINVIKGGVAYEGFLLSTADVEEVVP